jgi:hypothetical protein
MAVPIFNEAEGDDDVEVACSDGCPWGYVSPDVLAGFDAWVDHAHGHHPAAVASSPRRPSSDWARD